MKNPSEIRDRIEDQSEAFEANWHKRFTGGMTVADYVNSEMPGTCFTEGALFGLQLAAEILESGEARNLYKTVGMTNPNDWASWLREKVKEAGL